MRFLTKAGLRHARSTSRYLLHPRSLEERLGLTLLALAFLMAFGQSAFAHEFRAGDILIIHPWSRATPVNAEVAAGFFTLRNEGDTADRLVSATGEIAGVTQVHEMAVDDNGVMTMQELAHGLVIPAGGDIALKPGSFHIMFMKLKRPVVAGETFKGTLTFEKAGTVTVEYTAEAMGKAMNSGHDHHGK